MSAGDPHEPAAGEPDVPPASSRSAEARFTDTLLDGLTNGTEPTAGLSIFADTLDELTGLVGLITTRPASPELNSEDIVPLLDGLSRRFNAAFKVLRVELAAASPAGAP